MRISEDITRCAQKGLPTRRTATEVNALAITLRNDAIEHPTHLIKLPVYQKAPWVCCEARRIEPGKVFAVEPCGALAPGTDLLACARVSSLDWLRTKTAASSDAWLAGHEVFLCSLLLKGSVSSVNLCYARCPVPTAPSKN